jgi:hypothetical protein
MHRPVLHDVQSTNRPGDTVPGPRRAFSQEGPRLDTSADGIDVEETAAIALRFEDRMIGSAACSYVLDSTPRRLSVRVHGTTGWRWSTRPFTASSQSRRLCFITNCHSRIVRCDDCIDAGRIDHRRTIV